MGANQSASRPRSIPVRPRTPLRFGSVPTPQPIDPYAYNTRPVRNLYQNMQYADSITSILSQESYLCPPSPLSDNSSVNTPISTNDGCNTPISGGGCCGNHPHGGRWLCEVPACAYSVIGYQSAEELELHHLSGQHYAMPAVQPQMAGMEPEIYNTEDWMHPPPPMMPPMQQQQMYPIEQQMFTAAQPQQQQQQQCACQHCAMGGYHGQDQMAMYAPKPVMMQQPPMMIVGYNGPEVENLSWPEGQVRPEGLQANGYKRQRTW